MQWGFDVWDVFDLILLENSLTFLFLFLILFIYLAMWHNVWESEFQARD